MSGSGLNHNMNAHVGNRISSRVLQPPGLHLRYRMLSFLPTLQVGHHRSALGQSLLPVEQLQFVIKPKRIIATSKISLMIVYQVVTPTKIETVIE
jgi:hypothetical protein